MLYASPGRAINPPGAHLRIEQNDANRLVLADRPYLQWLLWALGLAGFNYLDQAGLIERYTAIKDLPVHGLTALFSLVAWYLHPLQRLIFDARKGVLIWSSWRLLVPWQQTYPLEQVEGMERAAWHDAEDDGMHYNLYLRIRGRRRRINRARRGAAIWAEREPGPELRAQFLAQARKTAWGRHE